MTTPSDGVPADVGVVVPAAGLGRRMGGRKKVLLELAGEPLLLHTLRPFLDHPRVGSVVVALHRAEADDPPEWLGDLDSRLRVVAGGATRLESVHQALAAVDPGCSVVLVHDGARPLVTPEIIDRCIAGAEAGEGTVAGWPSIDTLKEVDDSGRVRSTPDRRTLWCAQTPQAFPRDALVDAYRRAAAEEIEATDDSALFERAGGVVRMVPGAAWNLKVTYPEDLAVAELLLVRRPTDPPALDPSVPDPQGPKPPAADSIRSPASGSGG